MTTAAAVASRAHEPSRAPGRSATARPPRSRRAVRCDALGRGCPRPLQNQIDAARTLRIPLVGLHRRADFLALHAHRRPVELSCAGGKIATFADWQILSAHLGAGFDGGTLRSPACSEPLACPSSHPDGWTRPAGTEADPRGVSRTGGIPDQAFPHSPHPKRTSAQDGRLASMLQS